MGARARVATLTLACGAVTLISDMDAPWAMKHRWRANSHTASGKPYVCTTIRRPCGRQTTLYLHRAITQCPAPYKVDHRDNDTLNNQRGNLRIATQDQNNYNRAGHGLLPYKGVTRQGARFRARITHLEQTYSLGTYATMEEAARAYDARAVEYYGEFAYLNFPEEHVFALPDLPF